MIDFLRAAQESPYASFRSRRSVRYILHCSGSFVYRKNPCMDIDLKIASSIELSVLPMAYVNIRCIEICPLILGPISVAAYSYMSLVPIIQPL
jgi:hypothetical protein